MKIIILFMSFLALAGCSDQSVGGPPTDPIAQMESAFVDNPSQSKIKPLLEKAMDLYNLPINEDNYSRAGSVLVAMRKKLGVKEMDILSYMIRSHTPGVNVSFPDAAAISAVALAYGDR